MDEIVSTKRSSDKDGHVLSIRSMHGNVSSDVRKDLAVTHRLEGQFAPIGMRGDYRQPTISIFFSSE